MSPKKLYNFSKTSAAVAAIIAKVRAMELLSSSEELIYLTKVKNIFREEAQRIIDNKLKKKKLSNSSDHPADTGEKPVVGDL